LNLIRSIAALHQKEPHVGSVVKLLDVEVDLQFLLSARSRSQFPSDEAVCRRSARTLTPDAFAWKAIELAALQLAEPAVAADNRFYSDEIDQVVAVVSEHRVAESDQSTRLAASKASRGNRPKESTTDSPHGLISSDPWPDPVHPGSRRTDDGKRENAGSNKQRNQRP
jgi:hypothetical protein